MESNVIDIEETRGTQRKEPQVIQFEGIEVVDTAEDVDYDAFAPKQLTAAMLNQFAADHPETSYPTFPYRLPRTGMRLGQPGMTAKVRIINLTDRTVLNILPNEIRSLVRKLFFAGGATSNQGKRQSAEQRMNEQLTRIKDVAYAYAVAGFVEPKLVLSPEDIKDPEKEAYVGQIDLGDLTEFVRICEGDEQLAARRLEGFSV